MQAGSPSPAAGLNPEVQRRLLEDEGIEFDQAGYVDMRRYGWRGLEWAEVEQILLRSSDVES